MALSYGLDGRGFESRQWLGILLFTTSSRTSLGPTQPPIQWVPGAVSLGVKRPGREADHFHQVPRSRIRGTIPPFPQYAFMAWCSVKEQQQPVTFLSTHSVHCFLSRHSLNGVMVQYSDWASCWMTGVRFSSGIGNFTPRHRVKTGSGADTASYLMCTGGLFPLGYCGRSLKLIIHLHLIHLVPKLRMHGAIPPFPNMSSWRGAGLSTGYIFMTWYLIKHRENFTVTIQWSGQKIASLYEIRTLVTVLIEWPLDLSWTSSFYEFSLRP
jgi:hypothetical protein